MTFEVYNELFHMQDMVVQKCFELADKSEDTACAYELMSIASEAKKVQTELRHYYMASGGEIV